MVVLKQGLVSLFGLVARKVFRRQKVGCNKSNSSRTPIPSPSVTGGAGEIFEQHVDAFALVLLLTGAQPPFLRDTKVVRVGLQNKRYGCQTDDLMIVAETSAGEEKKLFAQIKLNLSITENNPDCKKIFIGFWKDYQNSDLFDASKDRLAVVVQYGTKALLSDFKSLLDHANASIDATDFERGIENTLSKKAKRQYNAVKSILTNNPDTQIEDKERFWRFLKTIDVSNFDLNSRTNIDRSSAISMLECAMKNGSGAVSARHIWTMLLEEVGRGKPIGKTYCRNDLSPEILDSCSIIPDDDIEQLQRLIGHGKVVRNRISHRIGEGCVIDRSTQLHIISQQLSEHNVVVLKGRPGVGKSALAKQLLEQIEKKSPVFAFNASEFAKAHIDETLDNAQATLNWNDFLSIVAGHDRIVILIDSAERLLDGNSETEAFLHLLQSLKQHKSVQLVITCREFLTDKVILCVQENTGSLPSIHNVPELSDDELEFVRQQIPKLALPIQDDKFKSFVRTPYILNKAYQLNWDTEVFPANLREFRKICWDDLICDSKHIIDELPQRREKTFISIACLCAKKLQSYVQLESPDYEALGQLVNDSLIVRHPELSDFFAPAHDMLEDWAIMAELDRNLAKPDGNVHALAKFVDGYLTLRRGFRSWLVERFDAKPDNTSKMVLSAYEATELLPYFQEDCLVAALLSDNAEKFLGGLKPRIENDNNQLLKIIHLLRVTCKEVPGWLSDVPGIPSSMMFPIGTAWKPVLQIISEFNDDFFRNNARQILGLVEDWGRLVSWNNQSPAGIEEAGRIIDALLPCFEGIDCSAERNRLFKVMLKIPKVVSSFRGFIARATKLNCQDRIAREFSNLILSNFVDGGNACRDFPNEVVSLFNARMLLDHDNDNQKHYQYHNNPKEHAFGFSSNGHISELEPASAFKGPFFALLYSHPSIGLEFVLGVLNHVGECYGKSIGADESWQTTFKIPGAEQSVKQLCSASLYCMYRGTQAGPTMLESALMALEKWLLELAEKEDECLETHLLHILRTSNNVMATAVVASVCIAYPDKAGKAGLMLLSSRELITSDRYRHSIEFTSGLNIFGMHDGFDIHRFEREQSNNLEHRKYDLENMALNMQMTKYREDVYQMIDRHHAEVSDSLDQDAVIWRLALYRMDKRDSRELEPEIQKMVEAERASLSAIEKHRSIIYNAIKAWDDKASQEAAGWKKLLQEARDAEREIENQDEFNRGGPGFVAAVCVRDHIEELDEDEIKWCINRIDAEISIDTSSQTAINTYEVGAKIFPNRYCAYVVPLLAIDNHQDSQKLLALALTHPIDEVSKFAYAGVGAFLWGSDNQLALKCAAVAVYQSKLMATIRRKEENPPYRMLALNEWLGHIRQKVMESFNDNTLDIPRELSTLNFNDWTGLNAADKIICMFCHLPSSDVSRDFYLKLAKWLALAWAMEHFQGGPGANRNFEFEHVAARSIANFVLKLPATDALKICQPIIDCVETNAKEVENFIQELIIAACSSTNDCFWDIWQAIVEKTVDASWINNLGEDWPSESGFITRIFLNVAWKSNQRHWTRLEGYAHHLDKLAERLPTGTACFSAYLEFLCTIGQQSLPGSITVVYELLKRRNSNSQTIDPENLHRLELLLKNCMFSNRTELKTNREYRESILFILEEMIASGSSFAYRMRDDFLTLMEPARNSS